MHKFTTPGGETMVILPLSAFEEMQDAADIASADRIKADIEAGREELLPAAMVERIVNGDNPIRVWREHRGLSARELAEKVGIGSAYLSEIETGKKPGTISVVKQIAEALGVSLDELV